MTPIQNLCTAQYSTHIRVPVNVNGTVRTIAMIDSGATGSFISKRLVDQNDLPTREKDTQYTLQLIDGSKISSGKLERETRPLPVVIQRHHEELTFDIVGMATHDIVLGMPWLKKHNPVINWKRGVLKFERTGDVTSCQPIRRQRTTIDKKLNREPVEVCEALSSKNKDDIQQRWSDPARTQKGQRGE